MTNLDSLHLMPRVQARVLALADRIAMIVGDGDFKKLLGLLDEHVAPRMIPEAQYCAELLGVADALDKKKVTGPILRTVQSVTFTRAEWLEENRQIFCLHGVAHVETDRGEKKSLAVQVAARIVPGSPPRAVLQQQVTWQRTAESCIVFA